MKQVVLRIFEEEYLPAARGFDRLGEFSAVLLQIP
jgi:hypothetical protein